MTTTVVPPLTISAWLRYWVLRRLMPTDIRTVLEIGAGRGALGAMLAREFDYVGLEPDAESFAAARVLLGDSVVQASDQEFSSTATFDAVCAFEVLEHIQDDTAALRRWGERIRPGGYVFLSVPADPRLFGPHDEMAGHYRRYARSDLERALREAGFVDVDIRAYGFPIGYALLAGMHLAARFSKVRSEPMEIRTSASGHWLQPSRRVAFVTRAVAAPFAVAQRPFTRTALGIGLIARARMH